MDVLKLSPGMLGRRGDPGPPPGGRSGRPGSDHGSGRELAVAQHLVAREQVQLAVEADFGVNRRRMESIRAAFLNQRI